MISVTCWSLTAMPTHFTTEHAAILADVDGFLQTFLAETLAQAPGQPALARLYDGIPDYLRNGGQRMHAVSVVLAFEACGGTPRTAILPVAAGFQLYHAHSLVHDDIYDDDDRRRGAPTVHRHFADGFAATPGPDGTRGVFRNDAERRGAVAGWIHGNIVRALAFESILGAPFDAGPLLALVRRLSQTDIAVNVGQYADVVGEGIGVPGPVECLAIATLKTGRLFAAGVAAGAALADASDSQTGALCGWIENLAVAYQLQDDLADLSRHSEKGQGRAVGTDLATCKPTYLLALARENGNEAHRAALDAWIARPSRRPEDIERMISILQETGAVIRCEAEVRRRVEVGLRALREASPPFSPDGLGYMDHFSEYFVSAEYWERPLPPAVPAESEGAA